MLTHCKVENTVLAYVAGIVDGEGTLGIYQRRDHSKDFRPRVSIPNTDIRLISFLRATFGGNVSICRRGTDKWKEAWSWCLQSKADIKAFLELIMPYLRLKREQAEILHAFVSLPHRYHGQEQRLDLCEHIHLLNKTGPRPAETTERVRLLGSKRACDSLIPKQYELGEMGPKSPVRLELQVKASNRHE